MRRVSYDNNLNTKQLEKARGLTFGDQTSLIYEPQPRSKLLRQFTLKSNKSNRIILHKQIRDYAEIRLDQVNFNSSMFATEDQNTEFLNNQKELGEYNEAKNAIQPTKIPEMASSFNYCQYCKCNFENYFSHIDSEEHTMIKATRFNKDQLELIQLFNELKVELQPNPATINLKSTQQIHKYDQAEQQILKEFSVSIHSFKMIERMVGNLKSRL